MYHEILEKKISGVKQLILILYIASNAMHMVSGYLM
jgi:hypothetical protein